MYEKRLIGCAGWMDNTYERILTDKLKDPNRNALREESLKHYQNNISFEEFVNKAYK